MCKNHSHLIAQCGGENTREPIPVLTFVQARSELQIQSPNARGASLILNTSGLLYVPSWALDGWSALASPAMGGLSTSLYLLPDAALTTILQATADWLSAAGPSQIA